MAGEDWARISRETNRSIAANLGPVLDILETITEALAQISGVDTEAVSYAQQKIEQVRDALST